MVFTPPRMLSGQNPTGSTGLSARSARRCQYLLLVTPGLAMFDFVDFPVLPRQSLRSEGTWRDDSTGGRAGPVTTRSMLARQRQAFILDRVREDGAVKVADLVRELRVSDMTVRRDLEILDDRGLLEKVHGGATSVSGSALFEPGFAAKSALQQSEKDAIADAAVATRRARDGDRGVGRDHDLRARSATGERSGADRPDELRPRRRRAPPGAVGPTRRSS